MSNKELITYAKSHGRTCLLIFLLILVTACADNNENKTVSEQAGNTEIPGEWTAVALPDITRQPIGLRVASVVNSRFKVLSDEQLKKILHRSQQMTRQHFAVEISFTDIDELSIDQVFSTLGETVLAARENEIVDIHNIDADAREKMQQALFKTLSNYQGNRKNVIEFAQPYLLHPDVIQEDFIGLSYALVDTLISRLDFWKSQTATDGKPLLDANGFHQWVWWDSLGYADLPYDIVITNQLVVSAEYYGMDVHSSIRGGITAGTTTYNKNTQFNSYAYIMVYPMLNDTGLLTTLRQDKTYNDEQIINYAAALLTHEIGHLLLHLGHPFGNRHCIMAPTVMLNYRDWYDHLDAENCPLGSSPAMQPGVAELEYNRSW